MIYVKFMQFSFVRINDCSFHKERGQLKINR